METNDNPRLHEIARDLETWIRRGSLTPHEIEDIIYAALTKVEDETLHRAYAETCDINALAAPEIAAAEQRGEAAGAEAMREACAAHIEQRNLEFYGLRMETAQLAGQLRALPLPAPSPDAAEVKK